MGSVDSNPCGTFFHAAKAMLPQIPFNMDHLLETRWVMPVSTPV